jgi:nucleoside phosphorylase
MIVAAAHHELGNMEGFALGVGPVRAAASAARLLALHTPSAVILIGTAGTYRRDVPVPSVIAAHKVGWGHAAAVLGAGYVPLPPEPLWTDERLRTVSGLTSADVLTVGAITTDRSVAAAWSADWALENMEAYGVALAAAQAGVPFLAILGVTNEVGPDAHAQWKANRAEVEQRVRDAVHPLLTLAAG